MKKPDKKATQSTKTFYPWWHKRRWGHHCSISKTGFDRNGSQILDKRFPRFFQRRKKVTTKHNTVFENNSKSLILKQYERIEILDVQNLAILARKFKYKKVIFKWDLYDDFQTLCTIQNYFPQAYFSKAHLLITYYCHACILMGIFFKICWILRILKNLYYPHLPKSITRFDNVFFWFFELVL